MLLLTRIHAFEKISAHKHHCNSLGKGSNKKKRWNFPSFNGWVGPWGVIFHEKKIAQNASNELKITLK